MGQCYRSINRPCDQKSMVALPFHFGLTITYLVRVAQGETHVGAELLQRLRQEFGQPHPESSVSAGRTLAELTAIAEKKEQIRERKAQQSAMAAKQKRLTELAPKADALWQEVTGLIELKQSKPYDQAIIVHLLDLRDLSEHQGTLQQFERRIQALKRQYSTRSGLLSRLNKVQL